MAPIKSKVKSPPGMTFMEGLKDRPDHARLKPGIGMQKPEPRALGGNSACVHLPRPARWTVDDLIGQWLGQCGGFINAATINNHDVNRG